MTRPGMSFSVLMGTGSSEYALNTITIIYVSKKRFSENVLLPLMPRTFTPYPCSSSFYIFYDISSLKTPSGLN